MLHKETADEQPAIFPRALPEFDIETRSRGFTVLIRSRGGFPRFGDSC